MVKKIFLMLAVAFSLMKVHAQRYDSYQHNGEIGASIGLANYFGDLNPSEKFNRMKFSGGVHYQYYLNNYFGLRASINYARLGYSDVYNSNPTYKTRNLSFNTDIWEFAVAGTFNFFRFLPGIKEYRFTPYVTAGVGAFNYNPFTYLNVNGSDQKVYLRPLGTEGQNSTTMHDGKKYGSMAVAIPLGVGVKYALNENWNIFAEVNYRLTTTDYIDDVSSSYAGAQAFQANTYSGTTRDLWYASQLQDRSAIANNGTAIGTKGYQRGNGTGKDSYLTFQVGVSFNLNGYKCPPPSQN